MQTCFYLVPKPIPMKITHMFLRMCKYYQGNTKVLLWDFPINFKITLAQYDNFSTLTPYIRQTTSIFISFFSFLYSELDYFFLYVCVCVYIFMNMCMHMCMYMYVCIYMCAWICIYICVKIQYFYVFFKHFGGFVFCVLSLILPLIWLRSCDTLPLKRCLAGLCFVYNIYC